MKLPICVAGAAGRMGRRLVALIAEAPDLELVGAIEAHDSAMLGRDAGELAGVGALGLEIHASLSEGLAAARVLVEFCVPAALPPLLEASAARKVAVVSGTTGLEATAVQALDRAAASVPVLAAPNFSLGVAVLRALVERAVRWLGPDADVEILELHHRHKLDAPSGTAVRLAKAAARASRAEMHRVYGRKGRSGPRQEGEIGLLALRGGDTVGEHSVFLMVEGERIELIHRALSRDIFVRGALRGARWVVEQKPGMYRIEDLLGMS